MARTSDTSTAVESARVCSYSSRFSRKIDSGPAMASASLASALVIGGASAQGPANSQPPRWPLTSSGTTTASLVSDARAGSRAASTGSRIEPGSASGTRSSSWTPARSACGRRASGVPAPSVASTSVSLSEPNASSLPSRIAAKRKPAPATRSSQALPSTSAGGRSTRRVPLSRCSSASSSYARASWRLVAFSSSSSEKSGATEEAFGEVLDMAGFNRGSRRLPGGFRGSGRWRAGPPRPPRPRRAAA